VRNDEQGKLVCKHSETFVKSDWRTFVTGVRGRGDLQPDMEALQGHNAKDLLKYLGETGALAVPSTKPWDLAEMESKLKRGPHQSCNAHMDFLREEILDFMRKGYWILLPWRLLKKRMESEGGALKRMRLATIGLRWRTYHLTPWNA